MKAAIVLALLACSSAAFAQSPPKVREDLLRKAMETLLKDAESARFTEIRLKQTDPGPWKICGQVNAKNSMGGYAGFTPFHGLALEGSGKQKGLITQFMAVSIGEVAEANCDRDGFR